MSFASKDSVMSSSHFVYFLFPPLMLLARTSGIMLSGNGERGHSCLVLDVGGKGSTVTLAVGFL